MRFLFPEERIVTGLWSDYDFPEALTQDSPHSFALELIERVFEWTCGGGHRVRGGGVREVHVKFV